jgi:hypothetical protein
MTIVFMSFFSFIITQYVDRSLGRRLFTPLVVLGLFSVAYWYYTESIGQGDLRLYGLVQFLPMLLIPMILLLYGLGRKDSRYYWYVILIYAIAKFAEINDTFFMTQVGISGHSLKHVISACTAIAFYQAIQLYHNESKG